MGRSSVVIFVMILSLAACVSKHGQLEADYREDVKAKKALQGIWLNESENVAFRAKGDTIFYPDSTSVSVVFKIIKDSIYIGDSQYKIVKHAAHLFWIENQNGDTVKYSKTDDSDYLHYFEQPKVDIVIYTSVYKTDTVVTYNNNRYHAYIAINPTKYRVVRNVLNDDGVEVGNIYYDNIINVSVFKGAEKLFSQDINKKQYARFVPESILKQSILNKMEFSHSDAEGLHFKTSICMPDAACSYMLDTRITYDGKLFMELME